ncbi:MAG: MBL fold metallo-hydrolase [Acidobacteria bacterium]|nr:MBL fold metallo-hydrolase [Acidobacteriota bacterium]
MLFHQFYLGCLAHASYLIGDGGEAAIVDPQRDVDQYIDEAARLGLRIRYIIETHLHADFVSGHRELAARTGAQIVIGAEANAEFPHVAARDGGTLRVGSLLLRAIATPGHTPEGMSWLVVEDGRPRKLLTGDTLFIGDVGRPDLAGGRGFTPESMASMLYDSLHTKILTLPDDVEVFPAHGAGSACGKNISKERSSTLGIQRRTNWALRPMPREEFVDLLTTDLAAAPAYFPYDAELNRRGVRALSEVTAPLLTADEVPPAATLLDVRDAASFARNHAAGAINIGLGGQFASWCGTLLSPSEPVVVIGETEAQTEEAVMRLARVGFENVVGRITDDAANELPRASMEQITVEELHARGGNVLDVRNAGEFADGHVPSALPIPLAQLPQRLAELPDAPFAVICAGGYRSSIAASLLARAGHEGIADVIGGTSAWVKSGLPVANG